MKFINKSRQNACTFFNDLPSSVSGLVDDLKEEFILDHFKKSLTNRILFEKNRNFRWPLWIENNSGNNETFYHGNADLLLVNSTFREWQCFTNYISDEEIQIDRSGMISGPGNSPWSVEFWILQNGNIIRPQEHISSVINSRSIKTGAVSTSWMINGISFTQVISGAKTSSDEALVLIDVFSKKDINNTSLLTVIRPYNNTSIGNIYSIKVNSDAKLIAINNKNLFAFEKKPERILTGSGEAGDIDVFFEGDSLTTDCPNGMATLALIYDLKSGKNNFNFRISLDQNTGLSGTSLNYPSLIKEFALFNEMRLSENMRVDLTDKFFSNLFMQCRISMLNINNSDIIDDDIDCYRKVYYYIYSLCRAGSLINAEELLKTKLENYKYNNKKPDFLQVIKGCFLVGSCYEIFIHKREIDFLQKYYTYIKDIADYIYLFSSGNQDLSSILSSTSKSKLVKSEPVADFIAIFSALYNLSYMARCRGIFGDEAKYKDESARIQAIIIDLLSGNKFNMLKAGDKALFGVFSSPEKVLSFYKNEEYKFFLENMLTDSDFPIMHNLYGLDSFTSCVYLNHLILAGVKDFKKYFKRYIEYIDEFHILPEYLDKQQKRGVYGDGNSKIINSVLFSLLRNMLFIDGQERLELLPMADESWFYPGSKIKVENAPSRFGVISFFFEVLDKEIRLMLAGSPKYLPSDIMINIPVKTSILPGDDFIMKKKIGNNYLISGWPGAIRFVLS